MIKVDHLSKVYTQRDGNLKALDNVSLEVDPGKIYGVVGPSGAGKSTLIRCINLLEKPSAGKVIVNGKEMTGLSPADLRKARQQIGMIFQHFNLLTSRTVAGNIAFPLEIAGFDQKKIKNRVMELLEMVGLNDKADAYPYQLSGGQKQRVGIARALANEPRVLLSDESTSALDPQNTLSILSLLKDLNRQLGLTILLITHEMLVVKQICDYVAVLQSGKIVEEGSVDHLVSNPESSLSRAFFPAIEALPPESKSTSVILTFLGDTANQPVLARLVKNYDVEVNILGGSIQNFNGTRIGQLQIQMSGSQTRQALDYLRSIGIRVEVD